jgi:hypothetical protein
MSSTALAKHSESSALIAPNALVCCSSVDVLHCQCWLSAEAAAYGLPLQVAAGGLPLMRHLERIPNSLDHTDVQLPVVKDCQPAIGQPDYQDWCRNDAQSAVCCSVLPVHCLNIASTCLR